MTLEQVAHFAAEEKRILTEHARVSGLCFLAVGMPTSGLLGVAYTGSWRKLVVMDITSYGDFRKWMEAFPLDFDRAQEHKAAREQWRLEKARRSGLPLVFIEKGPEDDYKPAVRELLQVRSDSLTERVLGKSLAETSAKKRQKPGCATRTR